jgi:hypothetical protein
MTAKRPPIACSLSAGSTRSSNNNDIKLCLEGWTETEAAYAWQHSPADTVDKSFMISTDINNGIKSETREEISLVGLPQFVMEFLQQLSGGWVTQNSWGQGLLGCDALCGRISTFRRTVLPPSSWHWSRKQQRPPKRRYPTTTLHGVTIQKTSTWILTAVRTSNASVK